MRLKDGTYLVANVFNEPDVKITVKNGYVVKMVKQKYEVL